MTEQRTNDIMTLVKSEPRVPPVRGAFAVSNSERCSMINHPFHNLSTVVRELARQLEVEMTIGRCARPDFECVLDSMLTIKIEKGEAALSQYIADEIRTWRELAHGNSSNDLEG